MAYYTNDMMLLIAPDTLKSLGVIDANLDEKSLAPIIKFVQDDILQNILGTKLYDNLLELAGTDLICQEGYECYKELLDGFIKWILAWAVMAECYTVFHTKLRNAGAVRITDNNIVPVSYSDMKKVAQDARDKADSYIVKLQKYLTCNYKCFPELKGCGCYGEKSPDKINGTGSPFYFDVKHRMRR